jgi:transcriptional regulator with XRE-family HTH domain
VANKKDILSIVGSNIRKIRISQKMSQNQLAYETGITREFINKIETGKYNISIKNLEKIAQILEIDIKNLLEN